jgi:hypothetical protein
VWYIFAKETSISLVQNLHLELSASYIASLQREDSKIEFPGGPNNFFPSQKFRILPIEFTTAN